MAKFAFMPMAAVKALVWRYFFGYWNNRRICSAIGGLPPQKNAAASLRRSSNSWPPDG